MRPATRIALALLLGLLPARDSEAAEPGRLRVIVETDAGGDPDDEQSLVRFLLYANEFDVEGIIANRPVARDGENRNPVRDGLGIVRALVRAYGECHANLVRHDPRFPTAAAVLARTVAGYDDTADGVNLILRSVDAPDPRPVWFCNWGTDRGSAESCLQRALDRVLRERGPEGYAAFKRRLRLSSADKFGDHTTKIEPPFSLFVDTLRPELEGRRWYHRFSALTATAGGFDLERDVRTGHGPLGALYPTNTGLRQKEGDTMMFLYLVPTGMNDPGQPGLGSWAGRYSPHAEHPGKPYWWADAADAWNGSTNRDGTLARWAAALQSDFRARMDWCVAGDYGKANHAPVAVLNGDRSKRILEIPARSGERVELTAAGSSDPDSQAFTSAWFVYPEAGTHRGAVALEREWGDRTAFTAPDVGREETVHVILQLTDSGNPPLCAWRRAVIAVKPSAVAPHADGPTAGPGVFASGTATALHRGVWEVRFTHEEKAGNPFFDVDLNVVFTPPDGREIRAEGFYRGGSTWACRAYCSQTGVWRWRSAANRPALDGRSGSFEVLPSDLPGKLRKHPDDPRQFAWDNGEWFLHLGDTGYRYVVDTEPEWKAYIDEAAVAGFTKIRTWFCRGRHEVGALFAPGRTGLDVAYWDEIERRVTYALERHPWVQLELIPYGEDWPELRRYGAGDAAARLVARHAQARFSAFPNVQWCISNDSHISPGPGERNADPATIDRIGRDLQAREPWGTLRSNHQARFEGYSFATNAWSDIVTLEDRDQVAGVAVLRWRERSQDDPVVLDEDRYGLYISPLHDRYYFRRLMWANLLSGGHATYGGLNTWLPFDAGGTNGVRGYRTAVREGRLDDGARDFPHIHRFFRNAGLTLVGLEPADAMAGGDGRAVKVIAGDKTVIAYLQNADGDTPQTADVRESPAACRLRLPAGAWRVRWFDPRTGRWHDPAASARADGDRTCDFTSPFPGDAVLLLTAS